MYLVRDTSYSKRGIAIDSGPLIYLAKLDAIDVVPVAGFIGFVPPAVVAETVRPALAYLHPDAVAIETALSAGAIQAIQLSPEEVIAADRLMEQVPGLGVGERQTLAVAAGRSLPAVLFDRRAVAVAGALGLDLVEIVELLELGTSSNELLVHRIRNFAGLVDMRLQNLEALVAALHERRVR